MWVRFLDRLSVFAAGATVAFLFTGLSHLADKAPAGPTTVWFAVGETLLILLFCYIGLFAPPTSPRADDQAASADPADR